jgi:hypothetical protein
MAVFKYQLGASHADTARSDRRPKIGFHQTNPIPGLTNRNICHLCSCKTDPFCSGDAIAGWAFTPPIGAKTPGVGNTPLTGASEIALSCLAQPVFRSLGLLADGTQPLVHTGNVCHYTQNVQSPPVTPALPQRKLLIQSAFPAACDRQAPCIL